MVKRRTLAVANTKGGTGKTTTAVCLGAALAEQGHRVLLVDVDPQCNATDWLGVERDARLVGVFTGAARLPELVVPSSVPGLDVLPGSDELVRAHALLGGAGGRQAMRRLRDAVDGLTDWQLVLLDTPPAVGLLPAAALVAAHEVLVPIEGTALSLLGLDNLAETVRTLRSSGDNPGLRLAHVLVARVRSHTRLGQDVLAELRKRWPRQLLAATVRETVRIAEAPGFGQPITSYAPSSDGAQDFRAVADELRVRWRWA